MPTASSSWEVVGRMSKPHDSSVRIVLVVRTFRSARSTRQAYKACTTTTGEYDDGDDARRASCVRWRDGPSAPCGRPHGRRRRRRVRSWQRIRTAAASMASVCAWSSWASFVSAFTTRSSREPRRSVFYAGTRGIVRRLVDDAAPRERDAHGRQTPIELCARRDDAVASEMTGEVRNRCEQKEHANRERQRSHGHQGFRKAGARAGCATL